MNGRIEIIAGTLGGGKSMCAVERAYEHLERGGYVFTNVEMHPEKIAERMLSRGYVFEPDRLVRLDGNSVSDFHLQVARGTADAQVLVMIDEAHLEWNSRDYAVTRKDTQAKEMLNFCTLVRKLDIILLFITQAPEDIDKQLRKKANLLWICRNMRYYKIWGIIPFPLPIMTRTCFDIAVGHAKPMKQFSEFFLRPTWACQLYNSDALLGQAAGKFAEMQTLVARPLKRVPRKRIRRADTRLKWVLAVVSFSSCVTCFL